MLKKMSIVIVRGKEGLAHWQSCWTCNHKAVGSNPTANHWASSQWITMSWFVQFVEVKPLVEWNRLAVASLVFISLCGSLPSSLDGKIIQTFLPQHREDSVLFFLGEIFYSRQYSVLSRESHLFLTKASARYTAPLSLSNDWIQSFHWTNILWRNLCMCFDWSEAPHMIN